MALKVIELLLMVLDMAVLFCECSLSIAIGLLCVTKSVLELIDLHMQIADLPLYTLIIVNFNAVDECGPGTLYCVLNIRMQQVDLPRALSPEQVVDVLMTTSTSFSMVDGNIIWPSSNFPSCTLMCSY